jgi:hypothetical protein
MVGQQLEVECLVAVAKEIEIAARRIGGIDGSDIAIGQAETGVSGRMSYELCTAANRAPSPSVTFRSHGTR